MVIQMVSNKEGADNDQVATFAKLTCICSCAFSAFTCLFSLTQPEQLDPFAGSWSQPSGATEDGILLTIHDPVLDSGVRPGHQPDNSFDISPGK